MPVSDALYLIGSLYVDVALAASALVAIYVAACLAVDAARLVARFAGINRR
jgi:hypothetical protein